MARTLLYTVQRVMEKLNLDPVNSISDSEDALLVSREAETTFYDMLTRGEWKQNLELLKVESVSELSSPTVLRLPDNVSTIKSVRYDCTYPSEKKDIRVIKWVSPEDFLTKSYSLNTDMDAVQESTVSGHILLIENNRMPLYYTSFDNEHLVFDAYVKDLEDTLNAAKTTCYGETIPEWVEEDTFTIPLQDNLYPLFLAALTSACSMYLNSEISQEDERRAARGISRIRREQARAEFEHFPKFKYGRHGNGLI
ncbi:MAG: hypothetical protein Tp1100MES1331091_24 [Prokaryotic dsDNA virus sp.]|nr:MAG: hypothetical protein Tp1100MES1331091_24 [Prokaryotic dsDNA virus sp.]